VTLAGLLLALTAALLQAQEVSHLTNPTVIHRSDPEYTTEALQAKLQGDVILSTLIEEEGIPSKIKVVRGLGMGLDEKAVACLKLWRFKPATRHGDPVPMKATIVFLAVVAKCPSLAVAAAFIDSCTLLPPDPSVSSRF
jgi:TonB family protein